MCSFWLFLNESCRFYLEIHSSFWLKVSHLLSFVQHTRGFGIRHPGMLTAVRGCYRCLAWSALDGRLYYRVEHPAKASTSLLWLSVLYYGFYSSWFTCSSWLSFLLPLASSCSMLCRSASSWAGINGIASVQGGVWPCSVVPVLLICRGLLWCYICGSLRLCIRVGWRWH